MVHADVRAGVDLQVQLARAFGVLHGLRRQLQDLAMPADTAEMAGFLRRLRGPHGRVVRQRRLRQAWPPGQVGASSRRRGTGPHGLGKGQALHVATASDSPRHGLPMLARGNRCGYGPAGTATGPRRPSWSACSKAADWSANGDQCSQAPTSARNQATSRADGGEAARAGPLPQAFRRRSRQALQHMHHHRQGLGIVSSRHNHAQAVSQRTRLISPVELRHGRRIGHASSDGDSWAGDAGPASQGARGISINTFQISAPGRRPPGACQWIRDLLSIWPICAGLQA